jgi:hypothetical protein
MNQIRDVFLSEANVKNLTEALGVSSHTPLIKENMVKYAMKRLPDIKVSELHNVKKCVMALNVDFVTKVKNRSLNSYTTNSGEQYKTAPLRPQISTQLPQKEVQQPFRPVVTPPSLCFQTRHYSSPINYLEDEDEDEYESEEEVTEYKPRFVCSKYSNPLHYDDEDNEGNTEVNDVYQEPKPVPQKTTLYQIETKPKPILVHDQFLQRHISFELQSTRQLRISSKTCHVESMCVHAKRPEILNIYISEDDDKMVTLQITIPLNTPTNEQVVYALQEALNKNTLKYRYLVSDVQGHLHIKQLPLIKKRGTFKVYTSETLYLNAAPALGFIKEEQSLDEQLACKLTNWEQIPVSRLRVSFDGKYETECESEKIVYVNETMETEMIKQICVKDLVSNKDVNGSVDLTIYETESVPSVEVKVERKVDRTLPLLDI